MSTETLLKTPLHALHIELGARMVPFAGYDMPVQYPAGVMKEHLHTRAAAGLFDVSHMGQVILRPKRGMEALCLGFEALMPVDVLGVKPGRQRYGLFTNETGGILDDLMFANRGDHLFVVVNAACKVADVAHMVAHLSATTEVVAITEALKPYDGLYSTHMRDEANLVLDSINEPVRIDGGTGTDTL